MSFIESKGHDKRHMTNQNDISKRHVENQNDISEKNHIFIGVFKNPLERSLAIYAKKIEKIVSAVYLVSDVMDQKSPLVSELRTHSLELINAIYALLSRSGFNSADDISRVFARLEKLISLIRIGTSTTAISVMNGDILLVELDKLAQVIASDIAELLENEQAPKPRNATLRTATIPNAVLADDAFEDLLDRYYSKRHQNDIKTTLLNQNDIINDIGSIKTTFQNDIEKYPYKIDRKQDILDAIKSRRISTLPDIKSLVKNCSDKTLQRELVNLVEMGLIKKEGNKRWTTYRAL